MLLAKKAATRPGSSPSAQYADEKPPNAQANRRKTPATRREYGSSTSWRLEAWAGAEADMLRAVLAPAVRDPDHWTYQGGHGDAVTESSLTHR